MNVIFRSVASVGSKEKKALKSEQSIVRGRSGGENYNIRRNLFRPSASGARHNIFTLEQRKE